jgi:hypothetical protein
MFLSYKNLCIIIKNPDGLIKKGHRDFVYNVAMFPLARCSVFASSGKK